MDTLDRYLVKEFLMFFIVVLFGLGIVFVVIDFLTKFNNMSMPFAQILQLYSYKVPAALNMFVPVACLMATLLVVSAMCKQNELLSLYASGVSNVRLVSTFIAAVSIVSTIAFLVFDPLVPTFQRRQLLLERGMDPSQDLNITYNSTGFWYRSGQILYNVGHFKPESNTLENVNVFVLSPEHAITQRIHAKRAVHNGADWVLSEGFEIHYDQDPNFPDSLTFESKTGVIPEKPSDFKTLRVEESTMRLKELRKYINRNKAYGLDTTSQQVNYHERVALVFAPLIFVLLAMAFSLNPLKTHSTAKSVSFCFLIVFLYLLTFRMSLSIGRGGHIPPFLAGWVPNFMFIGLSATMILKRH